MCTGVVRHCRSPYPAPVRKQHRQYASQALSSPEGPWDPWGKLWRLPRIRFWQRSARHHSTLFPTQPLHHTAQVGLLSALRVVGPWYPHLSAYVIIRNFGTLLAVIFIYTLCPDGSPKTPSTEMQQRGPGPEGAPHPALLTPLNSNRRPVSNNA